MSAFQYLNLDERMIIQKMLKEGAKTGTIASTLARSHSCIKQEIRKGGGRSNYNASVQQERADINKKARINKLSVHLTEKEKETLDCMIKSGESINQMSRKAGVTDYRIKRYLTAKGITNYKGKSMLNLITRIENLEEQCSILFELIKKE